MKQIEKRFASSAKVEGRTLSGVAVPYDQEARIADFRERFAAGSMRTTIANRDGKRDVVALVDHRADQLLGRQSSGTLKLTETARGIEFELSVPPTALGDEILALQARGDLGGVSFGFIATAEDWQGDLRTILLADLYEISIIRTHSAFDNGGTLCLRAMAADAGEGEGAEAYMRRAYYIAMLAGGAY